MIYVLILMLLTLLALIVGITVMAIGGKIDKKFSSKLMSLRVVLQALTLAILALVYFYS